MTGQKGALHQNTFCLGSFFFFFVQLTPRLPPNIAANTFFSWSFPSLLPSLAATPTCLHIHFIKLGLFSALHPAERAVRSCLIGPQLPPLLLNKWEGQWLLMTWDDDVCQCWAKDRFNHKSYQSKPVNYSCSLT